MKEGAEGRRRKMRSEEGKARQANPTQGKARQGKEGEARRGEAGQDGLPRLISMRPAAQI